MQKFRIVNFDAVAAAVAELCGKAACDLPEDVLDRLRQMETQEISDLGRDFFVQYFENARIARNERMALCQDTGFAVFFVELGDCIRFDRGTIYDAISEGVACGYRKYFLRKSIVNDPLFDRKNTTDNTPPVIHLELVPGDKLHITLAPKGGGAENMSAIRMLKPSDGRNGVIDFALETLRNAGGNPCPPTVVGMGIGGTFEKAAFLSKKALLRKLGEPNPDPRYAELEQEILEKINATNIGPQGLGGSITSLAVHIEFFPCHIASLPVAINLNCHAARHAEVEI
ncbi:MAG: fumarate hydratase [Victivallales bacterium]|jgi:fumarate hydratase subunit alpha|nr:fumarate hydratase [Victivallales bacterium]